MNTRCFACGHDQPLFEADYKHFTALFCDIQCQHDFHDLGKKKEKSSSDSSDESSGQDGKKKRHLVSRKNYKRAKETKKVAEKVVKVAPLLLI